MNLELWGWRSLFEASMAPYRTEGWTAGRVVLEHKHLYRVMTEHGELLAEISGKLRFQASGREDYPAVGDWVVVDARPSEGRATIHAILPRFSKFSRKVAGQVTEEQIVAVNVDTVFLVQALNQDFNVRRLERYLVLAWESGANPVVILSKADLCADLEEKLAEIHQTAVGVPVHAVSALEGEGLGELAAYVRPGQTVALLGSSGVGKSTLINRMAGQEVLATGDIREEDGRGRHTTTHRELLLLPEGGLLIDTPGMREIQLWEADSGLSAGFQDVEAAAEGCRFHNCSHEREPGCAVRAALEDGTLDADRYESYRKLQKELAFLARKEDVRLQQQEKAKWKAVNKQMRSVKPR
ncbi:ribosome small subunit-dependent GTPase A [Gorillibacterium sp. sgz5001074]|uniref:ribosome small subunit-dependent GTPase A n=1 Tax=Gorillibacterium sp. sgz5001074 TaxID=3446695 RepID=UPI003F66A399